MNPAGRRNHQRDVRSAGGSTSGCTRGGRVVDAYHDEDFQVSRGDTGMASRHAARHLDGRLATEPPELERKS